MPRPKRAGAQAPPDRADRPQAQAGAEDLPDLGHPATWPRDPGAADRRSRLEGDLFAATADRAGCTWATPGRSGWPTPARWRRRPCSRWPAARTRRRRSGPSAALAPSPISPPLRRALRQEAQQELAAGRRARAALPAAALGQAAGRRHHPRRRPAMMSRIEAPVLANQVLAAASRDLQLGRQAGDRRRQPLPRCRAQRDQEPRARSVDSELPKFWKAFDDAGLVTAPPSR